MAEQISHALGFGILHTLWQGLLAGLVLAILLRIVPHRHAGVRHSMAFATVMLLLILFVINIVVHVPASMKAGIEEEMIPEETAIAVALTPELTITSTNVFIDFVRTHASTIALVWLTGFLVNYTRTVIGLTQLRRLRNALALDTDPEWMARFEVLVRKVGIMRNVSLKLSARIHSPLTYGWLKPVVLLPVSILSTLPVAHIELILLHELAHVRRNDYLVNLLKTVAQNLLFFHPVMWWAARVMEEERERACDQFVMHMKQEPLQYVKTLAYMAGVPVYPSASAMALTGHESVLRNRINHILEQANLIPMKKRSGNPLVALVACMMLLVCVFGFTMVSNSQSGRLPDPVSVTEQDKITEHQIHVSGFRQEPGIQSDEYAIVRDQESSVDEDKAELTGVVSYVIHDSPVLTQKLIRDSVQEVTYRSAKPVVRLINPLESSSDSTKQVVFDSINSDIVLTGRLTSPRANMVEIHGDSIKLISGTMKIRVNDQNEKGNTNDPLFVIDGKIFEGGIEQLSLDPNNIESMTVLKGSTAAALYGKLYGPMEMAARGAIIITTKDGAPKESQKQKVEQSTDFEDLITTVRISGNVRTVEGKISTEVQTSSAPFVRVYPNPSERGKGQTVEINLQKESAVSVSLIDMSGALRKNVANGSFSGKAVFQIDTHDLESGMYILKVVAGEKTETHRIQID